MKKVILGIVSSCLLTLLTTGIILEARAQRAERATFHTIETISSEILGEKREILIQLPYGYDANPNHHYPVVFALDGGSHGQLINRTSSILQLASVGPGVIVVGISNTNRNRDLTPGYILQDDKPGNFGEGAEFLAFLEQELVPHIDQQYRTNGHRVLSGHSRAGLFAMYAFLEKPDLFQSLFCISPAFWRDDHLIVQKTKTFLERTDSLDHFLFLSLGTEENSKMTLAFENMIHTLEATSIPGLRVAHHFTPGATHQTNPYYSMPAAVGHWARYLDQAD